mmetsp:Transcript_11618/g.21031  ORF Transcript_11618/g.21031 Transcript_11618/m.21031 type:complete len:183 (+) Transcript_11618:338-886(+)
MSGKASLLGRLRGKTDSKESSKSNSRVNSNRSSLEHSDLGSRSGSKVFEKLGLRSGSKNLDDRLPMKAEWNDKILVVSKNYKTFEGTFYFPREELREKYFSPGSFEKVDPKKGKGTYLDIHVDGKTHKNAAYFFADPPSAASSIKDMVAFWKGVPVTPYDSDDDDDDDYEGKTIGKEAGGLV